MPDTGIGFFPSFRFGQPFFLGPGASETFYHLDFKDNFSLIHGKHTFKFGGEYLYSHNVQIFDGFALGRYIFGSTAASCTTPPRPATATAIGPQRVQCPTAATSSTTSMSCRNDRHGSPLFLYLQDAGTKAGETVQQAGYSNIANQEPAFFVQDTWQATSRFTLNYGLRWEAQIFPKMTIAPSSRAVRPVPLQSCVPLHRLSAQPEQTVPAARRLRLGHPRRRQVRSCAAAPESSTPGRTC